MKIHHIGYLVSDMSKAIQNFVNSGCILVQEPENAVAINNQRVAFLYSSEIGLFEIVEIK